MNNELMGITLGWQQDYEDELLLEIKTLKEENTNLKNRLKSMRLEVGELKELTEKLMKA